PRFVNAAVRALLLVLLVLALAEPKPIREVDGRAVAFVIDRSLSVPDAVRPGLQAWLERARADRSGDDAEEVILFGSSAAVELPFDAPDDVPLAVDLARPRSRVPDGATDIAGALRLALASFPEGLARRIVLVTDGNENRGHRKGEDAVATARRAAGQGVDLMVLPVRYRRERETSVLRVDAPGTAPPDSVVTFQPILHSTEADVPVRVVARVDGREVDAAEMVLPRGKSRGPEFRVMIPNPGSHEVSVSVSSEADSIPRNNEARAGVRVLGEAGVLLVDPQGADSEVGAVLTRMGIPTVVLRPAEMFDSPVLYQPFDAVVLSDVSAFDLTVHQMESLEVAVRDLGVGLLALGGEQAYSPGGYGGTALERVLPVEMELREKQVLLNGALVLILHTCEFADGNAWAIRIAEAAIGALTPTDYAGVVVYGMSGDEWAVPLGPVANPAAISKRLRDMPMGDMPSYDSSFELAVSGLVKAPAHLKHIVVISDGDAAMPNPTLIRSIVQRRITVSAVCISPHNPSDATSMAQIARWGKGRFYNLKAGQVAQLPKIFIKEATTLRRSAINRKPFQPKFTLSDAELPPALRGFGDMPKLGAFIATEPKERAEVFLVGPESAPVFARWRFGLGESAAFTSAVKGGWLGEWEGWAGRDRFLSQVTRSVFRKAGRSGFHAKATARGGVATIRVTATGESGEDLELLELSGMAVRAGEAPRPFPIVQKGAGIYEGEFPVEGEGSWVGVVRYPGPGGEGTLQLAVPVAVSYPEEYGDLATNDGFLARLRSEAGATILTGEENVFRGETEAGEAARSLAGLLLALAALLLPVDVFLRRVQLDWSRIFSRVIPKRAPKATGEKTPTPDRADAPPAPDFEPAPPEESGPESEPGPEPETKSRDDSDEPGHMGGLLDAKKRARRRQRWEETGQ
ncbi:MAG: hypothetical protein ABFS86_05700, partial [Planctomycetota bacterium]